MEDAVPIVVGAVIIAAVAVAAVLFVYVFTRPYVIIPVIALFAFLWWRRYKRRRV